MTTMLLSDRTLSRLPSFRREAQQLSYTTTVPDRLQYFDIFSRHTTVVMHDSVRAFAASHCAVVPKQQQGDTLANRSHMTQTFSMATQAMHVSARASSHSAGSHTVRLSIGIDRLSPNIVSQSQDLIQLLKWLVDHHTDRR